MKITCVACPMGCKLCIEETDDGYIINGNICRKGEEYGIQEMTDPRRNISSTAKVSGSYIRVLPVKTDKPLPKDKIFNAMKEINALRLESPIKIGDIVIRNVAGTDVNIIATRSIESKK